MTNYSEKTKGFFQDVYEVARLIPKGRVTSYGAIAKYLGSGKSARMVGWAMNASSGVNGVPAHRVVNQQGLLSGKHYFESPFRMEELLEDEGVIVENDRIKGFADLFWDPVVELEL
jgi:methylated-DNA-protein-cysteine methyltransferase-like protein